VLEPVETAALQLARRRVKRAVGQLRAASTDLAATLAGADEDVVGVQHATSLADLEPLAALVRLGLERHGELEIVILARPRRAPTTAPQGIGDRPDDRHPDPEAR
jgi:hypothetical protein